LNTFDFRGCNGVLPMAIAPARLDYESKELISVMDPLRSRRSMQTVIPEPSP
jgi:hypothetical protein